MSLRQKMLFTLAVSLILAFVVLGMALTAAMLEKTHSLAEETKSLYAVIARNVINGYKLADKPEGARSLIHLMPRSSLVDGWLVTDGAGLPIAHSFQDAPGLTPGVQVTPAVLNSLGVNTTPAVVLMQGDQRWTLHVASPQWKYLPADAWRIMLALFIGMLIVLGVAFAVIDTLVLAPMASLAAASRLLRGGAKPPPIPATQRRDEVGELVRSFQAMAAEVLDYRHNMEQKVEAETARRLQAERDLILAQRLATTSRLAAGIAHEINNPLGGVINAVRALKSGSLTEDKKKTYLELISDGLARIDEIVQKMLSFQKTKPSTGLVDVPEIIETALSLASQKLAKVKVEKDLHPMNVTGDKGELVQAVLNLILNAAEALSSSQAPRLALKASQDENKAVIRITDNGCGMPKEVLEHAFEPFFSAKETGVGLGLAITHTIIDNHGGTISLESKEGEGTSVTIRLPLAGKGLQ